MRKRDMLLLGQRYRALLEAPLKAQGAELFWLPDNPCVAPALAGHADLSAFYDGKRGIWLAEHCRTSELPPLLEQRGIRVHFLQEPQVPEYPGDVPLNLCISGQHYFHNPNTACPEILRYLRERSGLLPVPVKQGYAACTILSVGERGILTEDPGIAKAGRAAGFDVLQITPGSVQLPGYPHGFIGGAAFSLPEGKIAFVGALAHHPQGSEIESFLRRHGAEPLCLREEPLLDIGGAILLPSADITDTEKQA